MDHAEDIRVFRRSELIKKKREMPIPNDDERIEEVISNPPMADLKDLSFNIGMQEVS